MNTDPQASPASPTGAARPPRRSATGTSGSRPTGSIVGIVVAVVAVVLGFVSLNDLSGEDGDGGGEVVPVTTTSLAPVDTTLAPVTTPPPTVAPINKTGYKIEADPVLDGNVLYMASGDRRLYTFRINKTSK